MTRKDFERIARAIRDSRLDDTAKLVAASALAGELVHTNSRFEAGRFISACLGKESA